MIRELEAARNVVSERPPVAAEKIVQDHGAKKSAHHNQLKIVAGTLALGVGAPLTLWLLEKLIHHFFPGIF